MPPDEVVKPMAEGACRAPRGAKDAPFLGAHPCPRFPAITPILKDRAILGVVLGVRVGLVPAFESLEALHERVIGLGDEGAKRAGIVPLKLSADEVDVLRGVAEAVTGAVQRDEPLAGSDKVEQAFFLVRRDLVDVGVDDEPVEPDERPGLQKFGLIDVGDIDAARREGRDKLPMPLRGLVVPLVAEEGDVERLGILGEGGRREEQGDECDARHGDGSGTEARSRKRLVSSL